MVNCDSVCKVSLERPDMLLSCGGWTPLAPRRYWLATWRSPPGQYQALILWLHTIVPQISEVQLDTHLQILRLRLQPQVIQILKLKTAPNKCVFVATHPSRWETVLLKQTRSGYFLWLVFIWTVTSIVYGWFPKIMWIFSKVTSISLRWPFINSTNLTTFPDMWIVLQINNFNISGFRHFLSCLIAIEFLKN